MPQPQSTTTVFRTSTHNLSIKPTIVLQSLRWLKTNSPTQDQLTESAQLFAWDNPLVLNPVPNAIPVLRLEHPTELLALRAHASITNQQMLLEPHASRSSPTTLYSLSYLSDQHTQNNSFRNRSSSSSFTPSKDVPFTNQTEIFLRATGFFIVSAR